MKIKGSDMSGRGRLLNKAATFRGAVLNGVILLERILDTYLSCYFTTDSVKRDELMDMLFASSDGVPMMRKNVLFKKLIKKNDPDFYNDNSAFFSDLKYIIEQRNIFAHYLLDTEESAIINHFNSETITFIKYLDEEKLIHYDIDTLNSIIEKIERCIKLAGKLLKNLRGD